MDCILTKSVIRNHLENLIDLERGFGPATALFSYGQSFRASGDAPSWLVLGTKKECYKNAAHYVLNRQDVSYAEGYAVDVGLPIPIEHAWLIDDAGMVIDPTWPDSSDHLYFGVVFRKSFVSEMMTKASEWSGVLADHLLMRHQLGTSEAFQGALEKRFRGNVIDEDAFVPAR